MNFLTVDGGGSKLNAIWFDENLKLLGHARAKGVNSTVTPRPEYMKQIRACFDELFAGGAPDSIDCFFNICGRTPDYIEGLQHATRVLAIDELGECLGGLLAGRCISDGAVVIAGTGSNSLLDYNGIKDGIGGWGAILGDEGSGVWICRQAMQAAVRYDCGWGGETMLVELVNAELGFKKFRQLVRFLYSSPAPFQKLGSLLPLVGRAAKLGDEASVNAFTRGAQMLADQVIATLDRHPDIDPDIVACGGAWKAWDGMFSEFKRALNEKRPGARVYLPWFEHVLAGPAKYLLDKGFNAEQARGAMLKAFPQYEWRA